jgi:hypothetical protein
MRCKKLRGHHVLAILFFIPGLFLVGVRFGHFAYSLWHESLLEGLPTLPSTDWFYIFWLWVIAYVLGTGIDRHQIYFGD